MPFTGTRSKACLRRRLSKPSSRSARRSQPIGFTPSRMGRCGFDPAAPAYFPKQRFLMLMRNERLAALRTDYDEASHTLTVHWKAARQRAATCGRTKAVPQSSGSLPTIARTSCAGRPKCCIGERPQLLGCGQESGVDHQSGFGGCGGDCRRRAGQSAALSRQSVCRRLAGLA